MTRDYQVNIREFKSQVQKSLVFPRTYSESAQSIKPYHLPIEHTNTKLRPPQLYFLVPLHLLPE